MLLESRIGQVCMTLLRHPDETRDNKAKLRSLVDIWSRIIDTGKSDTAISAEERRRTSQLMQPTLQGRRRVSETGDQAPAAGGARCVGVERGSDRGRQRKRRSVGVDRGNGGRYD